MDDELIGTIKLFAFGFETEGYIPCDGRALQVNQYQALYSLLGVTYGGDGRTTFNVPKMDAPMKGMRYHICALGLYPSRS